MRYINIGENEYPLHFGAAALNEFCERFEVPSLGKLLQRVFSAVPRKTDGSIVQGESDADDIDLSTVNIPFSMRELAAILELGINNGYRRNKQPDRINEDAAFDLFDEKPGLSMEVAAIFIQSVISQVAPEEKKAKPGAGKKRVARALKG